MDPSLEYVLTEAIRAALVEVNVCLPGVVVKVDVKRGRCDVQPALMIKYADGELKKQPVIPNVPIGFYRSGKAAVYLPLHEGDPVELRFSQRSLEQWLAKGGVVDPKDPRSFHIQDAVAHPTLAPYTDPPTEAHPDNLVLVNAGGKVSMKPDGEILLEGTRIRALAPLVVLSGEADALALASKVKAEMQALRDYVAGHVHGYTDTQGAGAAAITQGPKVAPPSVGEVKSDKVKAE